MAKREEPTPIYAEMQKEMVWDIPPIKLPEEFSGPLVIPLDD